MFIQIRWRGPELDLLINIKYYRNKIKVSNFTNPSVYNSSFFVCCLLFAAFVFVNSCSRTNPNQSDNIEDTRPEPYFSVKTRTGFRTITDRNGNIKDTAYVKRDCTKTQDGKGNCNETITYLSGKQEERTIEWNIRYEDTRKILLTLDMGTFHMEGYQNSRMIFLKGKWFIPMSEVPLSSEWKIFRWRGSKPVSEEIQDYYWMNFYSGTVRTLWTETDVIQ